ncbi:hypothetical protein F4809DRAFT_603274 [Biscogniauxia mediterranea]|nr:hypothetical protein F4809DRAFT_603274 [Biscogniauxia mediterranea]
MTLKDDTQALERFALACGDRARRRVAGGRSEADREACRILTQVQKGLRMAQCALDKVSLPGAEGEVWVGAARTTLVLPEVMELD